MNNQLIEINYSFVNRFHIYYLKHELRENWSLYHKIVLELMFNEVFEKPVDIDITNNTIRFGFSE